MRVRLGVVADDLAGANAVGAQLAELGLPSIVTADPAALAAVPADRPAAVLDVDNRADPPDQAAAKVRAAVAGLTGSPYGGGVGVAAGADGVPRRG
ncbi:MAG: four-carbon acid sugar kinase family protein [Candidatus Methylomirabilales bacterium]